MSTDLAGSRASLIGVNNEKWLIRLPGSNHNRALPLCRSPRLLRHPC